MAKTKMASACITCTAALLLGMAGIARAQTINLKPAPAGVVIDGVAGEWGARLPYTNDKARISYTLSNDKNNLYLVIITKDADKQADILGSGITLGISTTGKILTNTMRTITFPARGKEDPAEYMDMDSVQAFARALLTKYRKIQVEGFAAITDKELSTANAYGIKAATGYNAGYLVYEEAIPLSLFNAEDLAAGKEWAFNIQINGLERTIKRITFYGGGRDTTDTNNASLSYNNKLTPYVPAHTVVEPLTAAELHRWALQLTPSAGFWGSLILAKP